MKVIGPVADTALSAHTTAWRLENVATTQYAGGASFQYGPQWVFWETNGYTGNPATTTLPTFPTPAIYYMQPIRLALRLWEAWKAITGERHYRQRAVSTLQHSEASAPATADGHFSGSTINQVVLGRRFLSHAAAGDSRIVAAKVWIDGVNVGGLVSFAGATAFASGPTQYVFGQQELLPFVIPIPLTTVSDAESVFVDLWIQFRPRVLPGSANSSLLAAPNGFYYYAPIIAVHGSNGPVLSPVVTFSPGIDAQRRIRSTDVWNLTLTGGTVGGVSSLAVTPQANWQYTNQGGLIRMLKTAGTAVSEEVQLNYATEAPEIRIRKNPTRSDGADGGWCKYMIQSPSYFGAIGQSNWQFGPITATGTNTFSRIARGFYDGANTLSPPWVDVAALPAPTIQLTGFPTSISATR